MAEHQEADARQARTQEGQINRALGLFICFFGATVLISMLFTETLVGQMTNLAAGLILVSIGAVMIWRSKPGSAG